MRTISGFGANTSIIVNPLRLGRVMIKIVVHPTGSAPQELSIQLERNQLGNLLTALSAALKWSEQED